VETVVKGIRGRATRKCLHDKAGPTVKGNDLQGDHQDRAKLQDKLTAALRDSQ
jgi:hypothetical protein